ncbi:MAG: SHOCT domain-containing protein [Clostridiales bacterium]|nr:SHOCT domain-containing protein [Clostridiales bacterium]
MDDLFAQGVVEEKPETSPEPVSEAVSEDTQPIEVELPDYVPIKKASRRPAPEKSPVMEKALEMPDPTKPAAFDPDATVALVNNHAEPIAPARSATVAVNPVPEKPVSSAPAVPVPKAASPERQTPPPIPKSAMAQRTAAARPAAQVSRPAAVPPPVPAGYTPRGAYVPRSQVETSRPVMPSYSSSSSGASWSTPGRVPAIIGAIIMAISMFLPCFTVNGWGDTQWYSWLKGADLAESPSVIIMLTASVIAIILAAIDLKGTKIAYFIYAMYVGIFAISNMADMNKVMRYFRSDFIDRGFGYYTMILAAVVIVIAGIVLLVNMNYGEDYSYSPSYSVSNSYMQNYHDYNREAGANEWRCTCGKVNPNFTGTCSCGMRKSQVVASRKAAAAPIVETNRAKLAEQKELEKIQLLKDYKELFDSGILSQEEFDEKKKKLLGK